MTGLPRDPLALTTRLIVDGSNLLHALSRGAERMPAATLIGRLRGVIPGDVSIELVFDGAAERGLRGERIAAGLRVRYSGPRSGDALILSLVDELLAGGGADAGSAVLVVTDDRDLRHRLRGRGARSAGTAWLLGRLERGRLVAPSAGNARPPLVPSGSEDEEGRPRWRPGRGATTKRGPSRKRPRRSPGT